ncbi:MAG: hypothetical protein Q9166_000368 [cf. Caloplaca sp. 2 TL-2023]
MSIPYTSHLSLPYTHPSLPLRTLDLHTPTTPPWEGSYTIIYIHGGAFRDPHITSQSLLPSLPFIFPFPNPDSGSNSHKPHNHVAAIASLNYRLSPYPHHPTHPSREEDESRNARWPDQVRDMRTAMTWLLGNDGVDRSNFPDLKGNDVVLVGHSVGATIALAVALGLDYRDDDDEDGFRGLRKRIKAVVGVEGIYDFTALRDAHAEYRGVYEEFTNGAFGDEKDGGWEKGNIVRRVREGGEMNGVEVVVLGQSREDELVEWGQVEIMERVLKEKGWQAGDDGKGKGKEVTTVELEGGHDEIWGKGEELTRCVEVAVGRCFRRDLDGSS